MTDGTAKTSLPPTAVPGNLRKVDAAMLERECGVRPTRGEVAMTHIPKPMFKGWREGDQWQLIEGVPHVRTEVIELLRERIKAARAAHERGRTIEQVMAACRRKELADEKAAQERLRIRLMQDEAGRTAGRRRRNGDVYVPIKDRS